MGKWIVIFSFLLISCKSVNCVDVRACNYFDKVYERIEDNYNNRNGETIIYSEDYLFLYSLTGIESEYLDGIDFIYIPTKQNLKDWKKWYNKNKHRLYWDEFENKVKLKDEK
ncbi:hypothetical protein [Myroides odoratus]|uniref:hypothetical protein n=1 Tax=Myroides odoratus TaxID=256 RepID=UPI00333F3C56